MAFAVDYVAPLKGNEFSGGDKVGGRAQKESGGKRKKIWPKSFSLDRWCWIDGV